ncbi:trans-aconitate 2-methyltransferase [Saccharopolyspora taberi]|uniref:Trans-aconitate 2-methyltransferase n=1 Tax=Saccharopolyspora taberi TaxID=60895 RepID=A0ABN3V3F5_9PSEU
MWDPQQYLDFSEHRDRPAHDLVARVRAASARRVVDLGCGAGNLTHLLTDRWPRAEVEALDSSPEMVESARGRGIDARVEDVREWKPRPDTDVVMCNAVLQWVPDHVDLLRRWLADLPSGAWFAFQVPGNFESPSHEVTFDLIDEPRWRDRLGGLLLGPDSVRPATGYADALADLGAAVDAWETTYVHALGGDDPVLEWITGTMLRPVRAVLGDEEWDGFRAELAPRLRSAYPRRPDGTTWLPFRRIFAVAELR